MTTISDRALLMGCFCTSRLIAAPTHTAPKMKNRTRCMILTLPAQTARPNESFEIPSLLQRHNQCCDKNVCNRQRQKKLPAKGHQLVITESGKRAPDPNVDKNKGQHFHHEPEHRQHGLQNRRTENRTQPASQEEHRSQ